MGYPYKSSLSIAKNWKRLLLLVFSFCALSVSIMFFILSIGTPYMGVVLALKGEDWVVESVDNNGLAVLAGIKEGDKPIEINGQPAQVSLEKYEKAGLVFGRVFSEIKFIDKDGQLKSVNIKDGSSTWQSTAQTASWFFVCFIFWMSGLYVLWKRPGSLAALLLWISSLILGLVLSSNMASERAIPLAPWLEVSAAIIGPWLLLHFFLVLPEERAWLHNKPVTYLIYLIPLITLILYPTIGVANGQPIQWFRTLRLLEYGLGFLGSIGMVIFNYFHTTSLRTRQQMKIILVSCFVALVPFIFLSILPEAIWRQTLIPVGLGILLIIFIPLGMGYAVITQKLMDIDFVIRRSVIYGLITLLMALILSFAIFPIMTFRDLINIPQEILLTLALGAIAAALFGPAKNRVERLVDKLFYKDRYDYRQIILSLSSSLNSLKEFADISRLVVGTTVRTLNLAGGCLFVRTQSDSFETSASQGIYTDPGKQKQLLTLMSPLSSKITFPNSAASVGSDVSFLIPLIAGQKEVGVLCLSHKNSRQDFSSDDIFLLQGIASVSAIALHSAVLIRDVSIRDNFVSIASHELRTPLTSIVGYADLLLRRDPPDSTRKKWLQNIFDSGQRISEMVDDLLNITRIHSGKIGLKLEPIKLSSILEERLTMARESTDKHKFIVNIEVDLPEVQVDSNKFGQVVDNLLSNAVKYSPEGGCITISACHEKQHNRVIVSISDEGMGIAPIDRDSLFKTFHRIQRPETQGIGGSGLGLYIAKEWTEAMGGEIWMESELNKGSTFYIAVPALAPGEMG